MEKIGNFDWIASYHDIQGYFTEPYLINISALSILVIGCGTSTLAESISLDLHPKRIVAVDNDQGCIDHMKKSGKTGVLYEVYDLVDLHNNTTDSSLTVDAQFDLIVDKGTFDAIHVEGSIVNLLKEISRLLKVHGRYLLFTINEKAFLQQLFNSPPLNLVIRSCESLSCDENSSLLVIEKIGNLSCSDQELIDHERNISSEYFQKERSLMSTEYLEYLQTAFESAIKQSDSSTVDLNTAYHIMFDTKPELEYSYSLFLGDVEQFYHREFFSFEDMISFLKQIE